MIGLAVRKRFNLMTCFLSVHPSQSLSSSNENDNNDGEGNRFDNFENAFDELDKQDKIHSQIDQGYQRWEDG